MEGLDKYMKIKKLGHCCLIIETKGVRIMTDPGNYSTLQNQEKNIDIVLITHEHPDHLHIDSLKQVVLNNPGVKIITNTSVDKLLEAESIGFVVVDDTKNITEGSILIEGYGSKHEEIYEVFGQVENTGYFIDNRLFYPGDAFYNPNRPIEILALPVVGPWMKLKQAIEYALLLKPKVAFPVHDGMLVPTRMGPVHTIPQKILEPAGIEFVALTEGDEHEF